MNSESLYLVSLHLWTPLLSNPAGLGSVNLPEKNADTGFPRPLSVGITSVVASHAHKRSTGSVVKQVGNINGSIFQRGGSKSSLIG